VSLGEEPGKGWPARRLGKTVACVAGLLLKRMRGRGCLDSGRYRGVGSVLFWACAKAKANAARKRVEFSDSNALTDQTRGIEARRFQCQYKTDRSGHPYSLLDRKFRGFHALGGLLRCTLNYPVNIRSVPSSREYPVCSLLLYRLCSRRTLLVEELEWRSSPGT
jgi:hypothetical protein